MKGLGEHYLIELYGCNIAVINDRNKVETAMKEAARIAGATIIDSCFHTFTPHGVSGVVLISESHFAIHSWPENGYAAVDLFTCGSVDFMKAIDFLKEEFGAAKCGVSVVARGILESSTGTKLRIREIDTAEEQGHGD